MKSAPQTRIGISGWTYMPWRNTFYPEKWPQKKELHYASRQVNSIEINGTFYSLQRPTSYKLWAEQVPDDFVFSVKGGRFLTHMRKLNDVRVPLANFIASGLLALGKKLGPILWQFPESFPLDMGRFEAFFGMLPHDTQAAAKLAREHEPKLKGRVLTETDAIRPMRHAVEIRHPSYVCEPFYQLLREHNVAIVLADTGGKWPAVEEVTADFLYLRLHGPKELYASGYDAAGLDSWAKKITRLRRKGRTAATGRDVFVYFDNDVKVRAPFDAFGLGRRLNIAPPEDATLAERDHEHGTEQPRAHWPAPRRR